MKRRRTYARVTQEQAVFYQLYDRYRKGDHAFVPVFAVMGEVYVKELGKWGYVSYECSARLSGMTKKNPGLLERAKITGKSGAKYYGYRIAPKPRQELIQDAALLEFYRRVKSIRDVLDGKARAKFEPGFNRDGSLREISIVPDEPVREEAAAPAPDEDRTTQTWHDRL